MKTYTLLFAFIAISVFSMGCADDANKVSGTTDAHSEDDDHEGHDHSDGGHEGHDHADHTAPHGGHLIELGKDHKYHAEMVDDHKTESVTVYILDGDMKPHAIETTSISLVLTSDSDTQSFELTASQPGNASEFSSNDENLMKMIEGEEVKGKLRATIAGKPFSGTFDHHEHGHEGEGDNHAGHNH